MELIRRAKGRGDNVTSEVCIANLLLTDEVMRTFDSNYKVNPPLRSQAHIDACIAGSQKLDKPMTTQQAKEFCEDQINKDK